MPTIILCLLLNYVIRVCAIDNLLRVRWLFKQDLIVFSKGLWNMSGFVTLLSIIIWFYIRICFYLLGIPKFWLLLLPNSLIEESCLFWVFSDNLGFNSCSEVIAIQNRLLLWELCRRLQEIIRNVEFTDCFCLGEFLMPICRKDCFLLLLDSWVPLRFV